MDSHQCLFYASLTIKSNIHSLSFGINCYLLDSDKFVFINKMAIICDTTITPYSPPSPLPYLTAINLARSKKYAQTLSRITVIIKA